MAASYSASETYGTSGGGETTTDTSYLNCLSTDTASGSDTTTNTAAAPITIPGAGNQASYERWYRGHFTGTFSSISNVKFWIQSWTPPTGVELYGLDEGDQTYDTPVVPSSIGSETVNTGWDSEGEAFTLGYSTNYTDYVSFFIWVGTSASQGAVNTWTLRCQWDET
jgi:hypothetical protein